MGVQKRRTAMLEIRASSDERELLALDVQRRYSFVLTIDGRPVDGGDFQSPIGDEAWRTVFMAIGEATDGDSSQPDAFRRQTETVKDAGRTLYRHLVQLSAELQAFLTSAPSPRRLVISSRRPEIHLLPWEAMVDDKWRSVAETDVSVVHALDTFDERPLPAPVPLRVEGIFGEGTEERTRRPLERLAEQARKRGSGRIIVSVAQKQAARGEKGAPADVLHVEAHGDRESGELELARRTALETPLAERLQSRSLVLLWSCFSALVHSWGESLGMKLHRQGNAFVLAFATELRYDSSADLADRFYDRVFGGTRPLDPESAVVEERRHLYTERVRACEWAALTLWLRAPIDLSQAVFDGPRSLPALAKGRGLAEKEVGILRDAIQQCQPGRCVLLKRFALQAPLTKDLFDGVRGAVVHLRANSAPDGTGEALETLGVTSRSAHRGDRLLAILDALDAHPGSMLVWSGVTDREVEALNLLDSLPTSLAILLVSPEDLPQGMVAALLDGGQSNPSVKVPGSDEISEIEELAEGVGRNRDAIERAKVLIARSGWTKGQKVRLHSALYWALARVGEYEKAEAQVRKVDALDGSQGLWLAGNLARRRGRYDKARAIFTQALAGARDDRDLARARLELGDLAAETSDPALAERLLTEAIATLEGHADAPNQPFRQAILGRALRDLADLLAHDPARAEECRAFLRRALVIHSLDGRFVQVAAALTTCGVLERTRRRWDAAESALASAVSIYDKCGNLAGWASAMWETADLAFRMEHYALALEIVGHTQSRLEGVADDHVAVRGRLAALAARSHWRLGSLKQAQQAGGEASNLLSRARSHEWRRIGELTAVMESLLRVDASPPVIGRLPTARSRSRRG